MNYKKWLFLTLLIAGALCSFCPSVHADNQKPRVSLITSLYNGAHYLPFFMEDIVAQVDFDQYQLIIINAHSPQQQQEDALLEPYVQRYPNIEYYHLPVGVPDPGIYGIWNLALQHMVKAPYVINANVDDALKEDALKIMADALDAHPEVDLVWGEFYITYTPFQSWKACQAAGASIWQSPEFSLQALAESTLVGNHPMWRASVHQKVGFFDASYRIGGDWDMWVRMALGGCKFKKIHANLGVYYANPAGLSTWREDGCAVMERNKVIKKYRSKLLKRHRKIAHQ